ncbi:hypothetical protein ATEIFO6365_0015003500 [Aspergillus terreus]|uniref:Uncharacterized protein n=1 Tax=Aspergillus terreus TaxID=33178 RepID=A0A5M3ZCZ6_ASPTE|nr:hypothetical protein ATETN484_0016003500 [Aspergillus terreus]GFF21464.1 hypothetical protein ATEIFO6365_0015003500 [Aspergillus terreus]
MMTIYKTFSFLPLAMNIRIDWAFYSSVIMVALKKNRRDVLEQTNTGPTFEQGGPTRNHFGRPVISFPPDPHLSYFCYRPPNSRQISQREHPVIVVHVSWSDFCGVLSPGISLAALTRCSPGAWLRDRERATYDDHEHAQPPPFTLWKLTLENPEDLDLSTLDKLELHWDTFYRPVFSL